MNGFRYVLSFVLSVLITAALVAQGAPQGQQSQQAQPGQQEKQQPPGQKAQPAQPGQEQRQGQPQQGSFVTQITKAMDGQTVTATGCLAQERDVAGQRPNPVERAGLGEDYVLTNVRVSIGGGAAGAAAAPPTGAGATPAAAAGGAATATGGQAVARAGGMPEPKAGAVAPAGGAPTPGSSSGTNVRVRGLSDQVSKNVGRQVEVVGRLEVDEQDVRPTAKRDQPIAELHATSIRVLNQTCTPGQQ